MCSASRHVAPVTMPMIGAGMMVRCSARYAGRGTWAAAASTAWLRCNGVPSWSRTALPLFGAIGIAAVAGDRLFRAPSMSLR